MSQSPPLVWDVEVFAEYYNTIRFQGHVPEDLERSIGHDLRTLLDVPSKNEQSRASLAAGENGKPVKFHNGAEYELNKPFIADASAISTEMSLDELCAAELLQTALNTSASGAELTDTGRLAFFLRLDFILNIVGYLVAEKKLAILYPKVDPSKTLLTSVLTSFKKIYDMLRIQNDLIDKQKVTSDINDLQFVTTVKYMKNRLFDVHSLLSQVLYTLIDTYVDVLGTWETYAAITSHVKECIVDDSDLLLMHYLPSLLRIASKPKDLADTEVIKFHQNFLKALSTDYSNVSGTGDVIDLSKSSIRVYSLVVKLMFFISFVPWCKEQETRSRNFDFENDILKYVEWLISYGTLEQVLSYTAESAHPEAKILYEQTNVYNFRPLLQKTFPELKPLKFVYPANDELLQLVKQRPEMSNVAILCDYEAFKLTTEFCDAFLAPLFHTFISNFISHAAVVLTLLRDSEEDFLLSSATRKLLESDSVSGARHGSVSGGDFDHFVHSSKKMNKLLKTNDPKSQQGMNLDEIATRAELERFYMSCVYTYSFRHNLCEEFWTVDDSNVVGFISWGISNNTSPLITATFCLLLGSLTYSENASAKVWDILINSQSGKIKRNDYSKISIDSIINSLTYYIDALTENLELDLGAYMKKEQKKQEFLFSSSSLTKQDNDAFGSLSIQLSEDSIVFISGFLLLVASIVKNACGDSPASKNLRLTAFSRFQPVITSFLKFDNLMISAKSLQNNDKVAPVVFNDENRTIIVNLILNLLSAFACDRDSLDTRYKIWIMVDRWLCYNINENDNASNAPSETTRYTGVSLSNIPTNSVKSELTKLKLLHRGISLRQSFQITLTNLSEVINFVQLMQKLLTPSTDIDNTKCFRLLYPANLGLGYRHKNQIGVWPYMEYLLIEVFGKTRNLKDTASKRTLQSMLLDVVYNSLNDIDWPFINDVAPSILIDLSKKNGVFASSKLVSGEEITLSYQNFLKMHHSLAFLNYLFDDRANCVLFDIINIGSEALENNSVLMHLVQLALKTFNKVLVLQSVFTTKILPLLKNTDNIQGADSGKPMGYGTTMSLVVSTPTTNFDNIYYPSSLGTKGVSDFYEILLFHIPSIVHFALYVGYPDECIAESSISILGKVSQSPLFALADSGSGRFLLQRNRLLSIFESIDESTRIQYGFAQQMNTTTDLLQTKFIILKYLIDNLPTTPRISVAHFLLGYIERADRLEIGGSEDDVILLRSLVEILVATLDFISEVDYSRGYKHQIGIGPAKLTALIMEIIVTLCQNSLTSRPTLKYLREFDLFSKLLTAQPKIDDMTIWENYKFEGDLLNGTANKFILDHQSCETFFSFITYRNCVLQYLSLELHDIKSITKKEYYVNLLLESTEFLNGTPKVLNFLDVLNYQFYNVEEYRFDKFETKYNLNNLLIEFKKEKETEMEGDQVSTIKKIITLSGQLIDINIVSDEVKTSAKKDTSDEVQRLEHLLNKFLLTHQLKRLHLKSLHSWVQIIQVLTSDGVSNKSDFILKVLQMVLPKINNDYYERDIEFAEELMSLCVVLFDLYEQENNEHHDSTEHKLQRLLPLFKTCVNGVLSPNSTASLRSDLYLLFNKFLQRSIKSDSILHHVLSILRSIDKRFIDIVCNDSIYSEGIPRITSIIFMESLIHLSTLENSSSILDVLINNNSLSLLVRSLKRTDQIIVAYGETGSGINVDTLLYELTALKSTLYVLTRIAHTKLGASQLVQNEIFPVIRQLKFLCIDADLGLDLLIDVTREGKNGNQESAHINLSLDVPLVLQDSAPMSDATKLISYYEFLVPTFQLVATVLLSMGPSYTPGIVQAKELMKHYHQLVVAIMKRDTLLENRKLGDAYEESPSFLGMKQLVRLLTLIDLLVKSDEKI